MAHAFFAPSSAPRVVDCPASLLFSAGLPDKAGPDAAHGTAAHWIADKCLRTGKRVEFYAGCEVVVDKKGECRFVHNGIRDEVTLEVEFGDAMVFEVDDEMVNAVQEYVDWCNEAPGEKYPECRVDISKYCPREHPNAFVPPEAFEPQGGTSDHAACSPGVLVITDLKYGKGVKVFAERNWQAVLYALGFIDEWDWVYDFQKIIIRICQPRLDHKDVWEITREEIEEYGRYILERFTLALEDNAPFGPSEKACKFCKRSGECKAQAKFLSEVRALAFDDLDGEAFPKHDERLLTSEELVEAWKLHGFYKARFEAIERILQEKLDQGPVPGVKLVEARTHRCWINAEAAAEHLELFEDIPHEKLYDTPSLISPAKVEKLLPKKQKGIIKTLAEKPRGGPCLAVESDPRPDYADVVQARIDAAFDDITE